MLILEDQPPAFLGHMPVLPIRQSRRPHPLRPGLDHRKTRLVLRADDAGNAPLDDPRLLARDLGNRLAQILLVIEVHAA